MKDNDNVYTLTLIFNQQFEDENGNPVDVPMFLPYSYSSEELAIINAEMAEEIYGEELESWGITKVIVDTMLTPQTSGEIVH